MTKIVENSKRTASAVTHALVSTGVMNHTLCALKLNLIAKFCEKIKNFVATEYTIFYKVYPSLKKKLSTYIS